MLTITKQGNNRLDIAFSGKLSSDEMREGLDQFITEADTIQHGVLCYRITQFHLPSLATITVKLTRLPLLLQSIHRFHYAAVLTDEKWIQTVSEWEGKLIPGLTIKAFALHEEAAAEAWLTANQTHHNNT